jgi:DNA-directed RNA polymerase specialized sigma24 family protein
MDVARANSSSGRRRVAIHLEYARGADLRRRRSRDLADTVLARCDALPESDAILLRAVFGDNRPMTEIALLSQTPVRRLRRRVRRLLDRLLSPTFGFVLAQSGGWTLPRRRVARAVVIEGKSYRTAGRDLGLSLHAVRRHCACVHAMCEAAGQLSAQTAAVLEGVRDA